MRAEINSPRVVHLSTTDLRGGAAIAAYRLHTALRQLGLDSTMYVARRQSSDPHVTAFQPPMDLPHRLQRFLRREQMRRSMRPYRRRRPQQHQPDLFTDDRSMYRNLVLTQLPSCDVINLHWIARFVDYPTFFAGIPQHLPVVWTLHDMNPFTGGCHYDYDCRRYTTRCGCCPQLGSLEPNDLSARVFQRKQVAFASLPAQRFHIVTLNRWMQDRVKQSALLSRFPVSVIPNSIDTEVFAPQDRAAARQSLGIDHEGPIILFAAQSIVDRRKGFRFLLEALGGLDGPADLLLLSLGEGPSREDFRFPQLHLGHIADERALATVYSAADLFVIPSIQDNLPNTILESLACGTPVVGFNIGGIPDMVRPRETGMLAPAGDVEGLRAAIRQLLQDGTLRLAMAETCRRIALDEYALHVQAERYRRLYESLLQNNRERARIDSCIT
jgi:glycosyltransferase involved in cell wall biosynthesis